MISVLTLALAAVLGFSACGDDSGRFKTPKWQLPDPTPDPVTPVTPDDSTGTDPVTPPGPVVETKPQWNCL